MRILVVDIECDNLLEHATKVHCIVAIDAETEEVFVFTSADDTYGSINDGLDFLYEDAEIIAGHNLASYDIPVLTKLHNWHPRPGTKVRDSLSIARCLRSNIRKDDYERTNFPTEFFGKHSLRAWGLRLGFPKGDYQGGWEELNQEMLEYCVRDTWLTLHLLRHLQPWVYKPPERKENEQ